MKWEYRKETWYEYEDWITAANERGKLGWEIITVQNEFTLTQNKVHIVYKRPVKDEPVDLSGY